MAAAYVPEPTVTDGLTDSTASRNAHDAERRTEFGSVFTRWSILAFRTRATAEVVRDFDGETCGCAGRARGLPAPAHNRMNMWHATQRSYR